MFASIPACSNQGYQDPELEEYMAKRSSDGTVVTVRPVPFSDVDAALLVVKNRGKTKNGDPIIGVYYGRPTQTQPHAGQRDVGGATVRSGPPVEWKIHKERPGHQWRRRQRVRSAVHEREPLRRSRQAAPGAGRQGLRTTPRLHAGREVARRCER